MSGGVLVGFVLTGVCLVVFLLWTWHELRRVDEVPSLREDRGADG